MRKPIRILLVEDSEDDAQLLIRALKKGGYEPEYDRVETAEAMRKALTEKPWDLILCDYKLPQFDGLAAIALLKETGIDLPFILVSGTIGEETAVEVMKAGAHDYIMKEKLSRLFPAIERELKETQLRADRRRAETLIIQSRREWENIFQAIGHPAVILDHRHGIINANKAVVCASGLSREELIGRKCHEIFHGGDTVSPPEGCPMEKLLASGQAETVESEMEALGGVFLVSCTPMLDQQGRVEKIIHIATDITAHKRAEQELIKSEERYRTIFENAQEGIFRSTPAGRIILANPAMATMFGYASPGELMAAITDVAQQLYVHPEERMKIKAMLEEQGIVRNYETQFFRKDGSVFWVSVTMQAIHDENGGILYYEGIDEDVTDRKESVDRLRKALGGTVQAISMAVETKDPYTAGHQRRTADLARAIATEMGLSADRTDFIRIAATIHDIGKIAIPAEILSKPTRLTEIEFNLIKTHSTYGYDILKEIEFPWPVADVILQHHERMDGSGYPKGLKGDEILPEARILAVADVVEAIASHRPYRPAYGIETALDEIAKNRGILYDSVVAEVCVNLFKKSKYTLPD
jgi:PAS domain S-box-containing protein/putative nucleotidyltransferase with HDIG domain